MDKKLRNTLMVGIVIATLSIVYYFCIFLPKNKSLISKQKNIEQPVADMEIIQANNTEIIPIEDLGVELVSENIPDLNKEEASVETKNTTNSNTLNEQQKQIATQEKQEADRKKAEALKKQKEKEDTKQEEEEEEDQEKAETVNVKTKIATWNIDCSPSNIAEETAHYRQEGLDYIQKLRDEGEKIIEVREEKCRFIIVMEDNSK